jgi:hypothetical protein
MNFGHESIWTTRESYGTLPEHRQAAILRRLAEPMTTTAPDAEIAVMQTPRDLANMRSLGSTPIAHADIGATGTRGLSLLHCWRLTRFAVVAVFNQPLRQFFRP